MYSDAVVRCSSPMQSDADISRSRVLPTTQSIRLSTHLIVLNIIVISSTHCDDSTDWADSAPRVSPTPSGSVISQTGASRCAESLIKLCNTATEIHSSDTFHLNVATTSDKLCEFCGSFDDPRWQRFYRKTLPFRRWKSAKMCRGKRKFTGSSCRRSCFAICRAGQPDPGERGWGRAV